MPIVRVLARTCHCRSDYYQLDTARSRKAHTFSRTFTFTLPQAMPTAITLLILSWLLQTTTESCPDGYNCHLERETYILGCRPFFDHLQLKTVNGTIEDVSSNATHLKITCTNRQLLVKLKFANLPNIRKLTLDNLDLATWDEDMFRGIANISDLVMTRLSCKRFENDSFSGLTNLQSLVIEDFAELEYMHQDMLRPLEALRLLSFRYVGYRLDVLKYEDYGRVLGGIKSTSFDTLVLYAIHSAQHNETQLNLTELFSHGSVDLRTLKKLRVLNLSDNKLITLSAKTRKELDEIPKVHVDISGNPLRCLCSNTDFVTWTHTSKVKFLNKHNTFCIDKDNSTNLLFHFDSEALINACRPNNGWYLTVLLPLGIVLIVISVLICVVYKYRWKRACCCSRLHVFYTSSDVQLEPVVYERDAFICYNSSDRAWVCDELLKQLEDNNVSTIIHQRDFLPGSVLHDAILESINKCRYTVLVFSPEFIASDWCPFETHQARSRIITQGRDVIVPIILREFPMSTNISRTLVGILEKSYLKWSDSPEEQVDFWDKLITKLKHGGNIRPLEM
ncbi:hypothetical protein LSAT2_004110 [Lamellibrachia satsuma]|nr:hypothetical protein LSAT2_004110 [Lamellibrachia satsuma]